MPNDIRTETLRYATPTARPNVDEIGARINTAVYESSNNRPKNAPFGNPSISRPNSSPTNPTPVAPVNPKPAYTTDLQPNFSQPVNQSPVAPVPQPSLGRSIATGVGSTASGFAGDYLGDRVNEALYGKSDGIGSQIGSVVGGIAGSIVGGATLGGITAGTGTVAGSIAGAGFGAFVGNVVGGGLDAIGNFFFGKKPTVSDSVDLGKNYNANSQAAYVPPFTGGQIAGVQYQVAIALNYNGNPVDYTFANWRRTSDGGISGNAPIVFGKILDVYATSTGWAIRTSTGITGGIGNPFFVPITGIKIVRLDGLPDTGGDLPNPNPFEANAYTTANAPNPTPISTLSDQETAANKEINRKLDELLKNDAEAKAAKDKVADRLGFDPDKAKKANEDAKPFKEPVAPDKPDLNGSKLDEILGKLVGLIALVTGLGVVITALKGVVDGIFSQTTAPNQQANAKEGVCQSMQTGQCGYEGVKSAAVDATNPIKSQVITNGGLLDNIIATLATFGASFAAIFANFTKLFTFLDVNAKVEAVKSTITLALTLHNALMLSQSLGQTLGVILDNVLNVFGNTFRSTDGSQISASTYLGATVQDWIINVIGAANYVQLSETLATANRIYQSGMNILNTVQTMLDSANAVAQATGIKLSVWMNAAKDDGVVSPKAYKYQDESALGNSASPLARFTALTTTISDSDSKAQNLVTITAAPIQVKDSIKQSKEDIKAFNDARDTNSQVNVDAKKAKLEAIAALKPITEATIGKRDDDT
jgi:hypothetical protein